MNWLFVATILLNGQINGPDQIEPYKLGRYEATGTDKSTFIWFVDPQAKVDTHTHDDGKQLIFVAPPGTYDIRLIEIIPVLDNEGKLLNLKSEQSHKQIKIGQAPTPPEPPEPEPPTPPEPVGPLSNLHEKVTSLVTENVPNNNWSTASDLAANYKFVADRIPNPYDTKFEVIEAVKIRNEKLGSLTLHTWETFRIKLGQELDQLEKDGHFDEPSEWKLGLEQITKGLSNVRR